MKPCARRILADHQDYRQRDCRLDSRERERLPQIRAAAGQRGDGDQERNDAQVLEQQNGHHVPAVRGVELVFLRQHLGHDCRRAHRQRATERDAREPAVSQKVQTQHGERGCNRDLREPEAENRAPHRLHLREAELEPDREHQEHDAELGEIAHAGIVGDPTERVRAQRDPDNEVTEDGRKVEQPTGDDDHHRSGQQQQDDLENMRHRNGVPGARADCSTP